MGCMTTTTRDSQRQKVYDAEDTLPRFASKAAQRKAALSKHVEIRLTEREALELWTLLFTVLSNADQWESYDLAALNRVAKKVKES